MEGAQKLLASEKEFKSKEQKSCDWRADCGTGTTAIRWMGNNVVHLAFTFIGNEEGEPLKRWCVKEKSTNLFPVLRWCMNIINSREVLIFAKCFFLSMEFD